MNKIDLKLLTPKDLDNLKSDIEMELFHRERNERMSKKMTKEELVKLYEQFGFIVPKGTKFWQIRSDEYKSEGLYGMEVGRFEHSCHIDSSIFIVLHVIDPKGVSLKDSVREYSDTWLTGCIVV
jgi:hypothetical protein